MRYPRVYGWRSVSWCTWIYKSISRFPFDIYTKFLEISTSGRFSDISEIFQRFPECETWIKCYITLFSAKFRNEISLGIESCCCCCWFNYSPLHHKRASSLPCDVARIYIYIPYTCPRCTHNTIQPCTTSTTRSNDPCERMNFKGVAVIYCRKACIGTRSRHDTRRA